METTEYRKIFRDIIRGYSETYVRDKKYYIKHLTSIDQVAIDEIRSSYYEKAIDRGIPPMSEILEDLNKDGIWTKKDESEIKRLELFVEQAQKTKSELVLKSQIDKQNESIRETRKKIQELQRSVKNYLELTLKIMPTKDQMITILLKVFILIKILTIEYSLKKKIIMIYM